ncbi:MAG: helix-turn-helix domain-containing protein [Streptosporangiales bacterium]|nr:helix-turn-helix domain-containing protein [Streptosporangiales bacterium]
MSELLRRAVHILDVLRVERAGLTIREVAAEVDLPKSTVQRLLKELVETDMAAQDEVTRKYRLGPRTLALGMAYQRRLDLRSVARPYLTRLRDELGETVGLSVPLGHELMHLDQVECAERLRATFEVGRPLPLWSGAPSRVLMMEMSEDEVRRIAADRSRVDYHPVNAPTPDEVVAGVAATRERGYAMAFEETIAGVSTIAVPLRGHAERVVATLGVTGPSSRFGRSEMESVAPTLVDAAREISAKLGGVAAS